MSDIHLFFLSLVSRHACSQSRVDWECGNSVAGSGLVSFLPDVGFWRLLMLSASMPHLPQEGPLPASCGAVLTQERRNPDPSLLCCHHVVSCCVIVR